MRTRSARPTLHHSPLVFSLACLAGLSLAPAAVAQQAPGGSGSGAPAASTPAGGEQGASTGEEKAQTAIPVGLSEPLGPPTDPFNDTRTLGYVVGGLRYVPDVNAAYFYETNPLRTAAGGVSDTALATYSTITISDAAGGPRKLFAGVAQTQWNQVNIGRDPRRTLNYEDRFTVAGWRVPVRLSYNHDVVSRSSFLARKINSEVAVTAKSGSVDAIRAFGHTRLTLTARATDVAIGSVAKVDGTSFVSSNSNSNTLLRAKITQPISQTTELYAQTQTQNYEYAATGLRDPLNPSSRVATTQLGIQSQVSETVGLSADIGRADKSSGRADLVPGASHNVGSVKGSWDPSKATSVYGAYIVGVAELNDAGVSNLLTRTWATGLQHKFTPNLATTVSYDRTHISANELPGNVVDSKFFSAILWKPHRNVLAAVAFSRTQRQVAQLQDFVSPFVNDRYLINITYYL